MKEELIKMFNLEEKENYYVLTFKAPIAKDNIEYEILGALQMFAIDSAAYLYKIAKLYKEKQGE
jgi:hypothetical protein